MYTIIMLVRNLDQTWLSNSSAFVALIEVVLYPQLADGLVLKVQDGFTHMSSTLGRMTRILNPAETVGQSAYI